MNPKYILYSALAVIFFVALFAFTRFSPTPAQNVYSDYPHTVELDGNTIRVAIADTPETRAQGLGERTGLMSDEGMLFIFPVSGKYTFWMKDMNFSIDILWLSSEGSIIYIVERVSPSTFPHSFVSKAPARYVLELPAGYVGAHGVRVSDVVRL